MTGYRKKYLKRFLGFSSILVLVFTVAVAYSIFVSERVHYGDVWDQATADLHSQNSWAVTKTIGVVCGGLFIAGGLVFMVAWFGDKKDDA
jgi:hypothetical protein